MSLHCPPPPPASTSPEAATVSRQQRLSRLAAGFVTLAALGGVHSSAHAISLYCWFFPKLCVAPSPSPTPSPSPSPTPSPSPSPSPSPAPAPSPAVQISLADLPLFSTKNVPGNLLLALSVEWPTASTPAYPSTSTYSASTDYYGYFDPDKCYQYKYDIDVNGDGTTNSDDGYFQPVSTTTSHVCSSTATKPLWNGSYLNWASSQTLDVFRWAMTGGFRRVDTTSRTIVEKTYHAGYGTHTYHYPDKALSSGISGATPFNWTSVKSRIWGGGVAMWVTGSATSGFGSDDTTPPTGATNYTGQSSAAGNANSAGVYKLYIRTRVCDYDSALGIERESNCTLYGTTAAKPEGLIQGYANQLRFSTFGYLNDSTTARNGAVMRARMKYVGPTQPVPGSADITNSAAEWSSTTGIMVTNPDSADATSTTSAASTQGGYSVTVSKSGVINYLNQFGRDQMAYKAYDPVSELFYAAVRYYSNLGNLAEYSNLAGAGSQTNLSNWIDGFPVIQTWDDPLDAAKSRITYGSCQKNFILGIGDVYSWTDGDLPGSTLNSGTNPTDTTVNVKTATDMVGTLEGMGALGGAYFVPGGSGRLNTYYIAGLAYDAHTRDLRTETSMSGKQRISTYWVDVMEAQAYESKNQYWLAAKYGGFAVPDTFSPYAASNGTSTISDASWYSSSDTVTTNGGITDRRPDNYFPGGNPEKLVQGLSAAFEQIVAESKRPTTTAFSTVSSNETTSGSISYRTFYDPSSWTASLEAVQQTYATDGTVTQTVLWDASDKLDVQGAANRKIVTYSGTGGVEFTLTDLTASAASLLTTLSAVPNALAQSTSNFIAYLRGDTTQERANGGDYRTRAHLLGDIVNAKLTVVGAPSATYYDKTNPGYSAFKRSNFSRTTVVYAGANDGMLHAFDGSTSGTTAGKELFAYIPSFLFKSGTEAQTSGLAALGDKNYAHHFYVDGTPMVFDVDFNRAGTATLPASNDWRSVLIGGLGKGGKGYYALDVSSPSTWTTQTIVKSKVLWEFTDSTMGYSYGDPLVIKTAKYGWVVVLTSGFNNSDGVGYLYFVNPKTGALLTKLTLPAGTTTAPLNLAQVTAFIPDITDYTATALYAGDIQGNLWRVDISGTGTYTAPTAPIAQLRSGTNEVQPVTTAPRVMIDPVSKKRYVFVGTGRLLADSDINDATRQTLYAIIDGTETATSLTSTITRANLEPNTTLTSGIGSAPTQTGGWYHDLAAPATSTSPSERINVTPTVYNGVLGVAVNKPNGDPCSPSGSSYVLALAFSTGKSVLSDSSGTVIAKTATVSDQILTDLEFKNVSGKVRLVAGRSDSSVTSPPGTYSVSGSVKHLNWREIPTLD